jgi:hypothetical protein
VLIAPVSFVVFTLSGEISIEWMLACVSGFNVGNNNGKPGMAPSPLNFKEKKELIGL